jgi:branched-subunit amino acid aminotransferase/4-amino-4-deoxychorismate lyase
VVEGTFELAELAAAEEAFTSSSVREVMPVVELDGASLGRGPAADELQAALRRAAMVRA